MEPRPRGRPRSFDPDRALELALDVFWERGFASTSLDDLCAAMGIARPSLYAAFGDKEAVYLATTKRFRDRIALAYREAMTGPETKHRSVEADIIAFLRRSIILYTSGSVPRGCMAVCTAAVEAPYHPKIREFLAAVIDELDGAYKAVLIASRERGELPRSIDPATLATALSALQQSIAIRARAGVPAKELERIATSTVKLLLRATQPYRMRLPRQLAAAARSPRRRR